MSLYSLYSSLVLDAIASLATWHGDVRQSITWCFVEIKAIQATKAWIHLIIENTTEEVNEVTEVMEKCQDWEDWSHWRKENSEDWENWSSLKS